MKERTGKFLDTLSIYAKTDMHYIVKGGFWLLIGQVVVFLLSLLLVWAFANLVSPEIYGKYRFLTSTIAMLALAALPGINIALVRSAARGYTGALTQSIPYRMRWSLFGTSVGLMGSVYYFYQGDNDLAWLFGIIALAIPWIASFDIHNAYLNGLKDFRLQAYTQIAHRTVVVSTLLTTLFLTENIFILIAVYILSNTIGHVGIYYYCIIKHPPNKKEDPDVISYSKELSVVTGLKIGSGYIDKLILWYLAGPSQIAIYVVALAIPNELQNALGKIGTLALPKMADKDKNALQEGLMHKLLVFFIFMIPIVVAYILFIPTAFKIFFPQYIESVFMAQILGLILLSSPVILLTQYFNATRQVKPLYVIQITEPIIFIVSLIVLVPIWSTWGAVIALILKTLISSLLHFYFYLKY